MIICFDLETTGLDRYKDRIIEISMVKFDKKTYKVVDSYNTFVDPGVPIPELISNITNIFDKDVEGAQKIGEIKKEIKEFIGDGILLGHNVNFDIDFFVNNGIDISNNIKIDTFFLANFLTYKNGSLNLEMLCNHYNIPFSGAHRAINDVKATIDLFKEQIKDFKKIPLKTRKILFFLFNLSQDKNVLFLRDFLFGKEEELLDINTFEKNILKKIGKIKAPISNKEDIKIDNVDIAKTFNFSDKVEKRENQIKMATHIYDGLSSAKKLVIEAPTGLGKSFAYLIPSILHSVKTKQKVFVTTKTKILQDQLYLKDLKFLSEKIGYNFTYTKLKGKRNYISIKNYFDNIFLGNFTYQELTFYIKISLWLLETEYGELDDLNFYGEEYNYLKNLNSDGFVAFSEKNQYKEYEFLNKARKKVETSDIVIINHSLLFSDLETEKGLLSGMKNLIIDEAHNIEDSVTESLKQRYNYNSIIDYFEKIEKIFRLKNIKKISFLNLKERLLANLEVIDEYGISYINEKTNIDQRYKTLLIGDDFYNDLNFTDLMKKISLDILDIVDILRTIEDYDFSKELNFLESIEKTLKIVFTINNSDIFIKIITFNNNTGLGFDYTLLKPGEYLKEKLWEKLDCCVLTSATLKIGDSFDYIKYIMNLDDFLFKSFESEFDYKTQATLFIPTNMGNIKNNATEVVDFLKEFFLIVRGKVLTLLTSFAIIRKIYTQCNIDLKKEGINVFAQSIGGSKIKLMSFFMDSPDNSILLGTDSFWEGVDIPGDDLKYLVIHKFPFQVPTDPIFKARSMFFKDPFLEYSVPKAIIKLKQGFGRLIRTKTDKGMVVLLDDRIINTRWGNKFYEAFPKDINIKKGTKEQFLQILEKKGE